ncbi:MAG: hypothetical protein HYX51_05240 [Chloroflexi bacterium]|nr:hypothetical protein [Chloroflexota bacterium]
MENRVERRAARAGVGRRRLLRTGGIMGGGLAAAFLAACGGGDNKPAAQSTSAPSGTRAAAGTTAAGGTTVAAATKPTGTVTVVQGVDANTLDPSFTNATPEANILYHVFETVLWRDPKTLLPAPRAAASFKNVDPLTWEFKLNPNMKFHDGTPADAEAAKFSIDRVAKAKIGDRNTVPSFARQVNYEETQVVDAVTFRIKLKAPSAILTDQLTSVPLLPPSVYNDESADNLAKVAQKPIGSGAWKFVEWKKDQQMVFDVNPAYYGAPPAFEKVIFKPVGETSTRILQLKNGEADVIVNVPPDNAADIDKSDKARISSVDGLRKIFVGLRADRNKALADKRVRQAINYALNWDAISRARPTPTMSTRPSRCSRRPVTAAASA